MIQDVTPVESRSTADAANRLLDTTLGLRHGDRVLQSLMRIGQDYKKGTILLLRLQGLADFYRHHGYETGGALLRKFAEAIEASLRNVPGVVRINPSKEQVLARLRSQPASGRLVIHVSANIESWAGTPADIEVRADDVTAVAFDLKRADALRSGFL